MDLVLTDVIRSKLIRRTVNVSRKRFHGVNVGANSMRRVVTALEFIQHPLAKLGHRKILLVTQTLTAQLSTCHKCSSRRASGFVQTILRSVVPGQLPDPARRGGRPQAPRRRDRLPLHPAYLELQPAGSLSHPLRRSRRRIISRSSALDPDQSPPVPVAYSNFTHRVSREVPPGTPPALPQRPARLPRSCRRFQRPRVVPGTDEEAGRKEVVRLCQAPLRRPLPCPALSRPLYPSHGHQQPSPDGLRWTTRQLPLAGLCPRQQAAHHDPRRRAVPAPLLPARAAQRLRAHPPLRPALQPLWQTAAAPGAHLAGDPEPPATSSAPAARLRSLALSPLRKSQTTFTGIPERLDRR